MLHLLLAIIYLSFISLGLPDALLGAAWPSMYGAFGVSVSCAGIVSMIIALGTIVSSLQSSRFTRLLGAGKITALSVGLTALALMGFSLSGSFWQLCLWAIPYGLGAGSVDAALNNYVALHYASRHMSWLHCMWGVGAAIGPYLMGFALTGGRGWQMGYRWIAFLQIGLTTVLAVSLPLWKQGGNGEEGTPSQALTLAQILRLSGVKAVMAAFFCYCALEQTAGLWASSYLTLQKGVPAEIAAGFASLFYLGITVLRLNRPVPPLDLYKKAILFVLDTPNRCQGSHQTAGGDQLHGNFTPGRFSVGYSHCLRRLHAGKRYHARTVTEQESHCPHCRLWHSTGGHPVLIAAAPCQTWTRPRIRNWSRWHPAVFLRHSVAQPLK